MKQLSNYKEPCKYFKSKNKLVPFQPMSSLIIKSRKDGLVVPNKLSNLFPLNHSTNSFDSSKAKDQGGFSISTLSQKLFLLFFAEERAPYEPSTYVRLRRELFGKKTDFSRRSFYLKNSVVPHARTLFDTF